MVWGAGTVLHSSSFQREHSLAGSSLGPFLLCTFLSDTFKQTEENIALQQGPCSLCTTNILHFLS